MNKYLKYTGSIILSILVLILLVASCVDTSPSPPGLPYPPSNVTATPGDSQVVINWGLVSGATSYNIYWSTIPDVSINDNAIVNATRPYTHSGLINDTTYYYVITAVNSDGESIVSTEVSATPISAPDSPSNVSALGGDALITITWDSVSNATSYNLYWSTSNDVSVLDTQIGSVTSPYVHTGLTNGTTYYYVITAVNSGGESSASPEASATPQVAPPVSPTNVTATPGDSQVVINWDLVLGATSYNIYWSTNPGISLLDNPIVNATRPYTHGGLINDTTYYYVVTAENAGGESNVSSEVNAIPKAAIAPTGTWDSSLWDGGQVWGQ